jgi:hypothetical protein
MEFPVGKTQKMVLDAMQVRYATFGAAEDYFKSIGIVVRSKRVGRSVQPEIVVKSRMSGGFTTDGDGETWQQYETVDLTPIQQWIVKA